MSKNTTNDVPEKNDDILKGNEKAKGSDKITVAGAENSKKNAKVQDLKAKPKKKKSNRFLKGIKEIVSELKKVSWPKFRLVMQNTLVVMVVVLFFFVVLFVFDYVLTGLLSLLTSEKWINLWS